MRADMVRKFGWLSLCFALSVACVEPEDQEPEEDMPAAEDMAAGEEDMPAAEDMPAGEDMTSGEADMAEDMTEEVSRFAGLRGEVKVWRDSTGVAHVKAQYLEDLFFVNGYLHAHDRLIQLEFYRRFATGRLSELAGSVDDGTIPLDVLMRTIGLKRTAVAAWEQEDRESEGAIALQSYSDGVNAYLGQWADGDLTPPAPVSTLFDADDVDAWHPSDSLAVARLLAFELTYIADIDVELTALRQRLLDTYNDQATDEDVRRRAGLFHDLMRLAPPTRSRHIEGPPTMGQALVGGRPSPRLPDELLEHAARLHHSLEGNAALEAFNALAPGRVGVQGSNNWVLSGDRTASGHANVANDPHLGLSLPTVFYPLHLDLSEDLDGREPIRVMGASYMGLPGVVIGRTDRVAWGTTTGYYDYVDVYAEQISGASDASAPATVRFDGQDVEVERITEVIGVGALGNVSEEIELTVEVVPHHGPILPRIGTDNRPEARPDDGQALSVRWVGAIPANEVPFLLNLYRAETPQEVEEALDFYKVGSSNFVFGFTSGDIFYSGQSDIPVRDPRALTFDPKAAPTGTAPVFVLPGDGSAEWTGWMAEEDIPHALNPEKGYVITANNDHTGTTFDNNPFNDEHYYGGFYAPGFRGERIEERLTAQEAHTLDEQFAIQDDDLDPVGRRMAPFFVEAVDTVLDPTIPDDAAPDLAALRAEVVGREAALQELRDLLDGWSYSAPASQEPSPGQEADDSAAAVLFNAALVYLQRGVLGDEFGRVGWYRDGFFYLPIINQARITALLYLLEQPGIDPSDMATWDEAIGDSWIFDDMNTTDVVETRLTMLVRALLQARARLASTTPLGVRFNARREIPSPASSDPASWVWGNVHGLSLAPLVPFGAGFERPEEGLPFFARPGGEYSVSPCNHDHNNFNFTCTSGSSLRMIHDMDPAGPVTYNSVPGGVSADPSSPFFDNQIETWNRGEAYEMLWDFEDIEADAVEAWTLDAEGINKQ